MIILTIRLTNIFLNINLNAINLMIISSEDEYIKVMLYS